MLSSEIELISHSHPSTESASLDAGLSRSDVTLRKADGVGTAA